MKESEFIKKNEEQWKRLEKLLHTNSNPDELVSLFLKVSGHLAYARSYYPRRSVRIYLNNLVNNVSDKIRTRKPYSVKDKLVGFYTHTIPSIVVDQWRAFVISFLVFVGSMAIGAFSIMQYPDFAREILGDFYVSMTEANISNDDPMAVYKDANKSDMFLGITINNIKVAFLTILLGILSAFGSIMILIKNGIMVGVFQTFFYQKGLFLESFLTIWIHGTIEISSIIIAGAAGIILGNSLFFRGSYSSGVALRNGAVKALFVILSTVPFFIIAGFLEGFVTRMTELPTVVKALIIGLSLFLIILFYIVLPWRHYRNFGRRELIYVTEEDRAPRQISDKNVLENTFVTLSKHMFLLIKRLVLPFTVFFGLLSYVLIWFNLNDFNALSVNDIFAYPEFFYIWPMIILVSTFMLFFVTTTIIFSERKLTIKNIFRVLFSSPLPFFLASISFCLIIIHTEWWVMCLLFLMIPMGAFSRLMMRSIEGRVGFSEIINTMVDDYKYILPMMLKRLIYVGVFLLVNVLVFSFTGELIKEFLSFITFFELAHVQSLFLSTVVALPLNLFLLCFFMIMMHYEFIKQKRYTNAEDIYDIIRELAKPEE